MDNKELNEKIYFLSDDEKYMNKVKGLEGTGKCIPYIGWFWRRLNFDDLRLPIGKIEGNIGHEPGFVGFMRDNKWDYPCRRTSEEEGLKLKGMLEDIVGCSSVEKIEKMQRLFDYIQTLEIESWDYE